MARNPVARDLRTPKYRPRIIPDKRHSMTYDHWKTTNPDDAWLGPDPNEEDEDAEWQAEWQYAIDRTNQLIDLEDAELLLDSLK